VAQALAYVFSESHRLKPVPPISKQAARFEAESIEQLLRLADVAAETTVNASAITLLNGIPRRSELQAEQWLRQPRD